MTPRLRNLLVAAAAMAALWMLMTSPALASSRQVTIVDEETGLNSNPMVTLETLKAMGVTQVKYSVSWASVLPADDADSTEAPAGSNEPSFYDGDFAQLAQIDQDAVKVGVQLDFEVDGPAPKWADGSPSGCSAYAVVNGSCNLSAPDFGVFMTALGEYFNGSVSGVPAVRWWSVWDEPNYGVYLSPQRTNASTYTGADEYRSLLDAAWTALTSTGHTPTTDTILFGELAPRGISSTQAGNQAGIKPVQFLASLYCVTVAGKRLSGAVAAENDCPSTAAAFRADNPALFDASGIAVHPLSQGTSPANPTADCRLDHEVTACLAGRGRRADPLWVDLASISNLEHRIGTDVRAYGSTKQFAIWSTEYGYWTDPPGDGLRCRTATQVDCATSPAKAEKYLNEAEYISYENPRIASFDQYQLYMPTDPSSWPQGLLTQAGKPEPTYAAWEIPLWLRTTSLQQPGTVTVWGGAKPAAYDQATFKTTPKVSIQFKARTGGWRELKTVTIATVNPGGYFSTTIKLTRSGSVRLRYTGAETSLTSRSQAVTVK